MEDRRITLALPLERQVVGCDVELERGPLGCRDRIDANRNLADIERLPYRLLESLLERGGFLGVLVPGAVAQCAAAPPGEFHGQQVVLVVGRGVGVKAKQVRGTAIVDHPVEIATSGRREW